MNPFHPRQVLQLSFRPFCAAALCISLAASRSHARFPIKYDREISTVGTVGVVDRGRLVRLKHDLGARRFVVGQGVVEASTAGDDEEIIYRNDTGPEVYPLFVGEWVADDLSTICGSSSLTRIAVQVTGGGDGTGPGFDIDVQLYSGCPSQNGVPISGTHFAVNLPDDGLFTVEYNLNDAPVPIGREVWLAIRSSSNHAGWVFGGEPDIGHSEDQVDTPLFGCSTNFGGCPPHGPACANGTATLYAVDCVPEFVAYRADAFAPYFVRMELNDLFADDITPTTHFTGQLCNVYSYEPQFAGFGGPYEIATEIWSDDPTEFRPLAPVPGTQCGGGVPCLFNPPVQIPTTQFFVAYDLVSGVNAGPVLVADYPSIGSSGDIFCIASDPPDPWSCIWFFGGCSPETDYPCATFMNEIICAGLEPTGTCCVLDSENDFHCEDDVPISACEGRFALELMCDEQPFDPPCGTAACCLDDETCQNLSRIDCQSQGGEWLVGEFCHSGLCFGACDCPTGPECCGWPGQCFCDDPVCCQTVCEIDSFCCAVKWDDTCCDIAFEFCVEALPPDECVNAVQVPCNEAVLISNEFATDRLTDPGFSCHAGGVGQNGVGSVWAKFTATATTARLRTCNSAPPADDSLLAVYTGTCGNLTEIACNDDTPGCAATNFNSEVCVSGLTVGQTYYVQLASWTDADRGRYLLELDCPWTEACLFNVCTSAAGDCCSEHDSPGCADAECCQAVCNCDPFCCEATWDDFCAGSGFSTGCGAEVLCENQPCYAQPPPNDNCADAIPVTLGTTLFNNAAATSDGPPLPFACDKTFENWIAHDVWFDFVSPSTGTIVVDFCMVTDFDSNIAVHEGCGCPAQTASIVACNDDGCGNPFIVGGPSRAVFEVVSGGCYKIRSGTYFSAAGGNGTLSIYETGITCPSGTVHFFDPPTGIVDARQPNPIHRFLPLLGIKTFTVSAPLGADDDCFRLCETAGVPAANSIESVTDDGMGTYTITLHRPMTPYAITRIAYQPYFGPATIGTFISHPANVNGDSVAGPTDILAIIDCLNGVNQATNCPWGIYSRDIDQSGVFGPSDILRVIDLLNGIIVCPWEGCPEPGSNPLPTGTCVP